MGKHKLTKQQLLAIKKQQEKKRQRAEQTAEQQHHVEHEQRGLLVTHYGQQCDVEDQNGQVQRCFSRKNLGSLAVGDHVIWAPQAQGDNVIVAVEPRQSELFRYNKFEGNKLVVSNIDQLFIVVAIEPSRAINVIDRYIMLAEIQNIQPIIVFNKTDLLDAEQLQHYQQHLAYYQQLSYPVFFCSTVNVEGISSIQQQLIEHRSVFVGLSGVGKSSLVKTLMPEQAIAIGELSEKSREGNHTTTTAKLFHLPNGGDVIDCPGIRELAMGDLTSTQVLSGFKDLAALAQDCQFRDCSHSHEPGCAILAAIAANELNPERFESYRSIIAEINNN